MWRSVMYVEELIMYLQTNKLNILEKIIGQTHCFEVLLTLWFGFGYREFFTTSIHIIDVKRYMK